MAGGSPADEGKTFNPVTEFKEFSRKQIQHYQKMFKHYDLNKDQYIDMSELSCLMDKLMYSLSEESLAEMMREVDEDKDGKIGLRDFLVMFRKGRNDEFKHDGWRRVYKQLHVDTS